jgi:hypothetical protein
MISTRMDCESAGKQRKALNFDTSYTSPPAPLPRAERVATGEGRGSGSRLPLERVMRIPGTMMPYQARVARLAFVFQRCSKNRKYKFTLAPDREIT